MRIRTTVKNSSAKHASISYHIGFYHSLQTFHHYKGGLSFENFKLIKLLH